MKIDDTVVLTRILLGSHARQVCLEPARQLQIALVRDCLVDQRQAGGDEGLAPSIASLSRGGLPGDSNTFEVDLGEIAPPTPVEVRRTIRPRPPEPSGTSRWPIPEVPTLTKWMAELDRSAPAYTMRAWLDWTGDGQFVPIRAMLPEAIPSLMRCGAPHHGTAQAVTVASLIRTHSPFDWTEWSPRLGAGYPAVAYLPLDHPGTLPAPAAGEGASPRPPVSNRPAADLSGTAAPRPSLEERGAWQTGVLALWPHGAAPRMLLWLPLPPLPGGRGLIRVWPELSLHEEEDGAILGTLPADWHLPPHAPSIPRPLRQLIRHKAWQRLGECVHSVLGLREDWERTLLPLVEQSAWQRNAELILHELNNAVASADPSIKAIESSLTIAHNLLAPARDPLTGPPPAGVAVPPPRLAGPPSARDVPLPEIAGSGHSAAETEHLPRIRDHVRGSLAAIARLQRVQSRLYEKIAWYFDLMGTPRRPSVCAQTTLGQALQRVCGKNEWRPGEDYHLVDPTSPAWQTTFTLPESYLEHTLEAALRNAFRYRAEDSAVDISAAHLPTGALALSWSNETTRSRVEELERILRDGVSGPRGLALVGYAVREILAADLTITIDKATVQVHHRLVVPPWPSPEEPFHDWRARRRLDPPEASPPTPGTAAVSSFPSQPRHP